MGSTKTTCTASVIQSQSQSIIVTAAHCIYDKHTTRIATFIVFIPNDQGLSHQLIWTASKFSWIEAYATSDVPYPGSDVAFIKLSPHKTEGAVEAHVAKTASVPRAYFTSLSIANVFLDAYGYRGNAPPSKTPLWHCRETATRLHAELYDMDCGFTSGASGGPVYHGYGADRNQYALLVQSKTDASGTINRVNVAQFGDDALEAYNHLNTQRFAIPSIMDSISRLSVSNQVLAICKRAESRIA